MVRCAGEKLTALVHWPGHWWVFANLIPISTGHVKILNQPCKHLWVIAIANPQRLMLSVMKGLDLVGLIVRCGRRAGEHQMGGYYRPYIEEVLFSLIDKPQRPQCPSVLPYTVAGLISCSTWPLKTRLVTGGAETLRLLTSPTRNLVPPRTPILRHWEFCIWLSDTWVCHRMVIDIACSLTT